MSRLAYGLPRRFFSRAKIDYFLLEFDTARAGDVSPFRFVPKDIGVVLGLVTPAKAI